MEKEKSKLTVKNQTFERIPRGKQKAGRSEGIDPFQFAEKRSFDEEISPVVRGCKGRARIRHDRMPRKTCDRRGAIRCNSIGILAKREENSIRAPGDKLLCNSIAGEALLVNVLMLFRRFTGFQ